jgi:hypothetical protein
LFNENVFLMLEASVFLYLPPTGSRSVFWSNADQDCPFYYVTCLKTGTICMPHIEYKNVHQCIAILTQEILWSDVLPKHIDLTGIASHWVGSWFIDWILDIAQLYTLT